jgi:pilus assembly protein FimV
MWLLPVLLLASQSWALGLGEIRLSSALNEPLRAEIELLAATPEELDNLRVQLASVETFERYDLDRPLFLSRLQFRIVRSGSADGNVVTITSEEPVTEPFVTFLVEASWTRGRLLREYTVLLDPPTFAPPPVTQSTQAITAPTRAAQTDSGRIQRPAPQPPVSQPEPAMQPPVQAPTPVAQADVPAPFEAADEPLAPVDEPAFDEPAFDTTTGGEVLVQRGDTLWSITSRVRPDSRLSMNQTMLAIFEANPQAFAGNINIMSAGATLRIPSADEIFRISRGDALAEVQRQNAAWGGVAPEFEPETQPSLTLLPPDEDVGLFDEDIDDEPADDVVQDLIAADEARIDEIETLLADHQDSLIELTDNELAALRAELAELRGEEPPQPLPVDDVVDETLADEGVEDPFVDDGEDELVADDLAADELEPTAIDEDLVADTEPEIEDTAAAAEDVAPAPTEIVDTPPRRTSLIDTILGYVNSIWGIIGGALIIAVGLLVWFARRAGSGADEDSTGMWESLEQDDIDEETMASTERLRALANEDDSSIVVVEQETAPTHAAEDSLADTFEMPAAEEQVGVTEPIAEAVEPVEHVQTVELVEPESLIDSPVEDSMMDTFEMPAAEDIADSAIESPGLDETSEMPMDLATDSSADLTPELSAEISRETPIEDFAEDEHVASMVDEAPVAEITPDTLLEDTFHSDTAINLDQADPVAEADFHMAYGLYDQAADLINGALEVEPERQDLLAKLCEIYFVWGNRDAFIDAAGKLRGVASGDANAEWDKIVIMGQQIAADHELFSGVSPAAATRAVDVSFEGGEDAGELDIDLEAGDETQAVDLSFDAAGDTGSGLDMDFEAGATGTAEVLDIGEQTAEAETVDSLEEKTSEMPVADSDSPTIEQQFDSLEATGEMPAVEEAGSDDATEIANVFDEEPAEPARASADATAEIELDDLGLDVDDLEDQISGLDDTSESQTVDDLTITGKNLAVGEEQLGATGIQRALEMDDDVSSETGEMPGIEEPTDTNLALPDTKSIDDTDVEIDISMLDATGQTQALSDDMAVDTGTSASLSEEDETMLADLASDESTVLAPDVDVDFAKTLEIDETGEMPSIGEGSTPDVDMSDLTGILEVSQVGDAGADHDAETAQMPHVTQTDIDPDAVDLDIGDDSPTMAASADDVAGESDEARTMTEVGTKLDLARAYVDMGDPNGARSILEEVLNEGDEGQRQQAQQLLESMPSS